MRDLLLASLIFGSIPFIFRQPFVGLLVWIVLSMLNPHRFTFGWAYSMPFAQIVAICTMISVLVHSKQRYPLPVNGITVSLMIFVLWLGVSPLFSFHPESEWVFWLKAFKIQVMVLLALVMFRTRAQIDKLTWALALSVGYFGIKGGLFTIATGGNFRVWGPPDSFIAENNALALAIIIVVPLFRYLQLQAEKRWIRHACLAAMILCTASALGSYSRGALLALAAMVTFLWFKSRHKAVLGMLIVVAIPIVLLAMPEGWMGRMGTIETYAQDTSALGRINAWKMAWNLSLDRFPIGGGFAIYEPDVFFRYAPDPLDLHVAHSIYFSVLGEHGFIGLFLFILVFLLSWLGAGWVIRNIKAKDRKDLIWASDLAAMCQVSIIGYAVGGAFLSLAYFDLPYYIVILIVILREVVRKELATKPATATPVPTLGKGTVRSLGKTQP